MLLEEKGEVVVVALFCCDWCCAPAVIGCCNWDELAANSSNESNACLTNVGIPSSSSIFSSVAPRMLYPPVPLSASTYLGMSANTYA